MTRKNSRGRARQLYRVTTALQEETFKQVVEDAEKRDRSNSYVVKEIVERYYTGKDECEKAS